MEKASIRLGMIGELAASLILDPNISVFEAEFNFRAYLKLAIVEFRFELTSFLHSLQIEAIKVSNI